MLEIKYSESARNTLSAITEFVGALNTFGAGERWSSRFRKEISKFAKPIKYALCRHKFWSKRKFHCVAIKNWVIIFKIENDSFFIYRIIHASTFR